MSCIIIKGKICEIEEIIDIMGENTRLKSLLKEAREKLDFYSKPFVNEGAYCGNICLDRVHGSDCEVIGAFSIGGKLARQFERDHGEELNKLLESK